MADEIQQDAPAPDAPAERPGPVPYARFHELTQRHQQVTAELDRLRSEVVQRTERAAQADALAKQLAELQAQHAAASQSWAEERTFLGVGLVNPEGQALARTLHGLLPAEGRPAIGDWLGTMLGEGGQVHPALSHYLGRAPVAPAPASPAPAAPAPASPMPRPSGPAGAQPPSASPVYSAEQIRALREEAQRTGDYTRLRAAMPGINASLRTPPGR